VNDLSQLAPVSIRHYVSDDQGVELAAQAVRDAGVVTHGFANFYCITSRPEKYVVVGINRMKGRPDDQVGSVTTTPVRIPSLFDWSKLPAGLSKHKVLSLMDALYDLGPFGFRGPAGDHMPEHLTSMDGGIRTTQVIAPGRHCDSNRFLARAMDLVGEDYLYITSANRSRHVTGAEDEPAHWRGTAIKNEFAGADGFFVLRHPNEPAARERYRMFEPMSTTILAFHKIGEPTPDGRIQLVVERHGSLHLDYLKPILEKHGFGMVLGPKAQQRLGLREYEGPESLVRPSRIG
jgi:hypothetical protein